MPTCPLAMQTDPLTTTISLTTTTIVIGEAMASVMVGTNGYVTSMSSYETVVTSMKISTIATMSRKKPSFVVVPSTTVTTTLLESA